MTAVDMAKLNRPGVMSSYSSSGRKNTVHGSKSTVVGSTFNQARMTAATKFLSPSKGGHVSARIMAENSAPRYLSGSETAIIANRGSGQVASLQSGTSIFGVGAGMMMPSMPMGGMSTGGVLGFLAGTAGAAILNKILLPGAQAQSASQQLDSVISTAVTLTPDNVNFEGVSQGISDAINSGNADDLSKAITSGHAKLASMDGMTSTYESAVETEEQQNKKLGEQKTKAEAKLSEATGNVDTKQKGVDNAKKGVDSKKAEASKFGEAYQKASDGYVEAHNKYIDAQNATKSCQSAFDNASKEFDNATTALGKATQAATDATNAYNAEPAVDKNGNPNPKKDQLRAKMNLAIEQKNKAEEAKNAAERAKNDAQTKLNDAKEAEIAAKNNETTAKGDLDKAKENVTQNKQDLAKFESDLKAQMSALDDAKGELNDAKINQQTAQTNLNNITAKISNGAKELLAKHKENREKLAADIKNGEAKLKELQSKQKTDKPSEGNPLQQLGHKITEQEQKTLGQPTDRFTHDGKDYTCYQGNIYACNGSITAKQTFDSMKTLAN